MRLNSGKGWKSCLLLFLDPIGMLSPMLSFKPISFLTLLFVFSLSIQAWAADQDLWRDKREDRTQIPVKTDWQVLSERTVENKNFQWDLINRQFQSGKPPHRD